MSIRYSCWQGRRGAKRTLRLGHELEEARPAQDEQDQEHDKEDGGEATARTDFGQLQALPRWRLWASGVRRQRLVIQNGRAPVRAG